MTARYLGRTVSGPIFVILMAAALAVASCGGGSDSSTDGQAAAPARYARLLSYGVTPTALHAPVDTAEIQHLQLAYGVDFKSDTVAPTYRLTTHVLPLGQALVSADQTAGRIHTQFCGQEAYACGQPHSVTCMVQAGWLNAGLRYLRCDSYNPALELDPGTYQFIANVCEITANAVTNCTIQTVQVSLP